MLQDNLTYVFLLAVVGVVALTANYILSMREQQNKVKEERLKFLAAQGEHITQALAVLREAGCKTVIVDKIDEHLLSIIEEIGMLAPDSPLYADLTAQKNAADQAIADPEVFANDKAVKRAQIYINFSEKLVLQMARGGKLTTTLARNFKQELYRLKVNVVVGAHRAQGLRYKGREEPLIALSHFKHAKALLVGCALPAIQKKDQLKELQELISEVEPKRHRLEEELASDFDKAW